MSERHEPVARKAVACAPPRRHPLRKRGRSAAHPIHFGSRPEPSFHGSRRPVTTDVDLTVSTLDLRCHVFSRISPPQRSAARKKAQSDDRLDPSSQPRSTPRRAMGGKGKGGKGTGGGADAAADAVGDAAAGVSARRRAAARRARGLAALPVLAHGRGMHASARGRRGPRRERGCLHAFQSPSPCGT